MSNFILYIPPEYSEEIKSKLMALALAKFDKDSDEDEILGRTKMFFTEHLRRQSLIRIVSFPAMFMITWAISGWDEAVAIYDMARCYWFFLRGKIKAEDIALIQSVAAEELLDRIQEKANEKP